LQQACDNLQPMPDRHSSEPIHDDQNELLLSFWAFGDLHYRARKKWQAVHMPRMKVMFEDLQTVWQLEGTPTFCVSPGDIVNNGGLANYELAKRDLRTQLGEILFYPGIGNHEFLPDGENDGIHGAEEFCAAWEKPVRYTWISGEVLCIMLDHPDPFSPDRREPVAHILFSDETLAFLEASLASHPNWLALIFAHCPLRDTVLDRDPECNLDDDSQDRSFFVENSRDVRAILAHHRNAGLYISGHTHSGWGSPQLVFTETLGGHPVTHINLMSPWYTGRHHGPRRNAQNTFEYSPDDPDVLASFAIRVYRHYAHIRVRDHRTRTWLRQWEVPLQRVSEEDDEGSISR